MSSRLDFIETRTGLRFRPLAPDSDLITIEDIAHALSHQCRFSGHTRWHYSVAEHSCRVSWLLDAWGEPADVQLWGLLHDASEAYLVDIPQPLKHTEAFRAYRVAERALQIAICARFGLPHEEPAIVKKADAVLLATEARDLMPYRPEHWATLEASALPTQIHPFDVGDARAVFLREFEQLQREIAR